MEGKKQTGSSSSSSSFTSELFGSKDSYSGSSKGIFGAIFAPSSEVLGRESLRPGTAASKKQDVNEGWNTKSGLPDNATRGSKGESLSVPKKETTFVYQEERPQQPCHLSSSIFYGGQDNYYRPQSSQSSGSQSNYGNNDGQDDSGHASRGIGGKGLFITSNTIGGGTRTVNSVLLGSCQSVI